MFLLSTLLLRSLNNLWQRNSENRANPTFQKKCKRQVPKRKAVLGAVRVLKLIFKVNIPIFSIYFVKRVIRPDSLGWLDYLHLINYFSSSKDWTAAEHNVQTKHISQQNGKTYLSKNVLFIYLLLKSCIMDLIWSIWQSNLVNLQKCCCTEHFQT